MHAWNWDKLDREAQAVMAFIFENLPSGWTRTYMIEVKLNMSIDNMMIGNDGIRGDCLHMHGGNGSKEYAHFYDNPEWAVVHIEDAEIIRLIENDDWKTLIDEGSVLVQAWMSRESERLRAENNSGA